MSDFLSQILIHDDPEFVVINKPSGLLSVPGKGDLIDSVLTRLVACDPRILLVHRLDRDTSGLMVFARSKHAQRHISRQFELRQTEKQYQALALGELCGAGKIDVPVRYDPTRPPMHIADETHPKHALTHWQAQPPRQLGDAWVTPVFLQPVTGRSHQLRVHLQYLGHPIAGDLLYADAAGQAVLSRLALHAQRLAFDHPLTEQRICIENRADFW
ncbi:MAG: RluA family pseudouridine synthase [Pseudomonadota bacterium]|nr:RluA family pseudouridine synthase [Pseudomonadota bacterium]